ncbi:hypothetical protein WS68_06835, partial [Burkholderia sp. TSV86]
MKILHTRRSRIVLAGVAAIAFAGFGLAGVIGVRASAPDKAQAPLTEVDVAGVLSKTVTDWQS